MKDINLVFIEHVSGWLKEIPNIQHEWLKNDTEVILRKRNAEGFDISIGHREDYLYLATDRGYHDHFEAFEDFSKELAKVLGLARDLLSTCMRIREISTNSRPRKWILERYRNSEWKKEAITGLLVWNYLGRTTERCYSNDVLPANRKGEVAKFPNSRL